MALYEKHRLEDNDLPFIYREQQIRPNGLMFGSSNWHENIEIIYARDGDGAISNNGAVIPIKKGYVSVVNANHLHTLAARDVTLHISYLIIDRIFCLANGIDTSTMSFETLVNDGEVTSLFDKLDKAYSLPPDSKYRTLTIRTLVLQILLLLCSAHGTPIPTVERTDRSITYVKQAIVYIRASYDKSFSLDDVADFVGVNKCYLSREFHKYTGYPFVAYVNRTRCKMACRLIADSGLSISEAARKCGFENRSYFAKCFRKYIGESPVEYRARARDSAK